MNAHHHHPPPPPRRASNHSLGSWLHSTFGSLLLCATLLQAAGTPSPIVLREVTRRDGHLLSSTPTEDRAGDTSSRASARAWRCSITMGTATWTSISSTARRCRAQAVDPPPRNALYRNDGNWKFTDVTEEAGVGDLGYGLGVCVGDYDNDGHLDIYLNNFGPNVLYRNNGDGTFTDVTQAAGVATAIRSEPAPASSIWTGTVTWISTSRITSISPSTNTKPASSMATPPTSAP
jgi:hypothetical protein